MELASELHLRQHMYITNLETETDLRKHMYKSQIAITHETLKEIFGFPNDVHIACVKENQESSCVIFNIMSQRTPPKHFNLEKGGDPKKLGYAFDHPDEFQEDTSKGYIRGADDKE